MLAFASQLSIACDDQICQKESDLAAMKAEIKKRQEELAKKQREAFTALLDETFAPVTDLPGQECLDGLMKIDISAQYVDAASGIPNIAKALVQQIVDAGCDAAVAAVNAKVTELNGKINKYGSELSEETSGLVSFESETKTDGTASSFSLTKTSIKDSKTLKDLNKKWNDEFNEKAFGDTARRDSDVDLSADKYNKNSKKTTTEKYQYDFKKKAETIINNASDWINDGNNEKK